MSFNKWDAHDFKNTLNDLKHLTNEIGIIGIEKESLRINNKTISQKYHPKELGSALCNKYITTDFSESLIEIITPPLDKKTDVLPFIEDIHHFVNNHIGDETLWPFSMPPYILPDEKIPIAKYGISNQSLFKTIYRKGLSHRYGRVMQTIAGVHFNYSYQNNIWKLLGFTENKIHKDMKSKFYFGTIRNMQRMNWLILFLFGASPIITKNFSQHQSLNGLKQYRDSYFMQYATSLRMSDLGYQNTSQANLRISLDGVNEYARDLRNATETEHKEFQKIFTNTKDKFSQLNANILQIEDEYYSTSRPKTSNINDKRMLSNLVSHGVDYIELRSLDLNPFSSVGIDYETIQFLEIFIIYSSLLDSPFINQNEMKEIKNNDLETSIRGRDPELKLFRFNKKISIEDWGNQILDGMLEIEAILDLKNRVVEKMRAKIMNPDETISAMIIERMHAQKIDFNDLGNQIGEDNKKKFLERMKDENFHWITLEEHAASSLSRQSKLECSSKNFDQFVNDYFNS